MGSVERLLELIDAEILHNSNNTVGGRWSAELHEARQIAAALREQPEARGVPVGLERKYPDDGNGDDDAYNRGWNECLEALTQQPAQAAPGWKLVPEKITTEMWKAWEISNMASESYQEDYAAMLAAAPTPPGDDAAGGGQ